MNEKWNVLTYRDYDFTDKTGVQRKGRTLHCYRNSSGDRWPGIEYAKFTCAFGTEAYNVIPTPGKAYTVVFNRFGKVESLIAVS